MNCVVVVDDATCGGEESPLEGVGGDVAVSGEASA